MEHQPYPERVEGLLVSADARHHGAARSSSILRPQQAHAQELPHEVLQSRTRRALHRIVPPAMCTR